MAAPVPQGAWVSDDAGGTGTLAIAAPAGVVEGELLLLIYKSNNVNKSVTDWGGFTQQDQPAAGSISAGTGFPVVRERSTGLYFHVRCRPGTPSGTVAVVFAGVL